MPDIILEGDHPRIISAKFVAKLVRAGLYEKLIESVDRRLSRDVYKR
jgi:hypothetical protein